MLSNQIQKLMEKSPEIIANHIQNYCQGLDEKEENIKALFLYESFVSTQGTFVLWFRNVRRNGDAGFLPLKPQLNPNKTTRNGKQKINGREPLKTAGEKSKGVRENRQIA